MKLVPETVTTFRAQVLTIHVIALVLTARIFIIGYLVFIRGHDRFQMVFKI